MTWSKKEKLGILKLVLLFNFFSSIAFSQASFDRLLIKINDDIISGKDLEVFQKDYKALKCYIPDSVLVSYLGEGFNNDLATSLGMLKNRDFKIEKKSFSANVLDRVRLIWKTKIYIKSQKVDLSPVLVQELDKASKRGFCPSITFGKSWRKSFKNLLETEVYMRSRFLPPKVILDSESLKKRIQSLTLFVDSIDRQYSHENFW
jgi:hypothetical protein